MSFDRLQLRGGMLNSGRRDTTKKWAIKRKEQSFSVHLCIKQMQKKLVNKEKLVYLDFFCHVCTVRNPQINRTSGCVTTPDLGDSLWQENNNPQFLKIDKLVYSHAVNCLISRLTNHKLKVTGFPTTSLCSST